MKKVHHPITTPKPKFSSLSELLESIKGRSFDEAHELANREYSTASHQIEEIQRVEKMRAIRVNPPLFDYSGDLCQLLSAMEHPGEFFQLPDGYTKRQIESALKTLTRT